MKDLLSDLFEGLSIMLRPFLLLWLIFFALAGLSFAIQINNGNLVWKAKQQQLQVSSAVTQADLKALMAEIYKLLAQRDNQIEGLQRQLYDKQNGRGKR